MRRRLALFGFAGAVALCALGLAAVPSAESRAADAGATFVVPVNDGYGIGECVGSGSACGQVVADQWCLAQGFARSVSFGEIDPAEVTGSINGADASRPISITCSN